MKLAEALLLRSEYQKKIGNLQSRIIANIKVQENDSPHEGPRELLKEVFELTEQLCTLIKKINARNNTTKLPNGMTISEAIVERDMMNEKTEYPVYYCNGGTGQADPPAQILCDFSSAPHRPAISISVLKS